MPLACLKCGHVGEPASRTPGSMAVEVVLWLCFLLPGLVYSLWRLSARRPACDSCGALDLVPVDSPKGRALASAVPPTPAVPAYRGARGYGVGRWLARLFGR